MCRPTIIGTEKNENGNDKKYVAFNCQFDANEAHNKCQENGTENKKELKKCVERKKKEALDYVGETGKTKEAKCKGTDINIPKKQTQDGKIQKMYEGQGSAFEEATSIKWCHP